MSESDEATRTLAALVDRDLDGAAPVLLHRGADGREVYWIGSARPGSFRCNAYLLRGGGEVWLIDPGAAAEFDAVRERVATLLPPSEVTRLLVHHQDPDLCGSLPAWLEVAPTARIHTTDRAAVLIEHYGIAPDRFVFTNGSEGSAGVDLRFVMAPFLHSPASFATYDPASRLLFTSDIFGAIADAASWRLVRADFDAVLAGLEFFHTSYMASNKATRGFVRRLEGLPIDALLPQHGSILVGDAVPRALDWLAELRCGLDLSAD